MRLMGIGMGDGGCAVLPYIQSIGLRGVQALAMNTHPGTEDTLLIGESVTGGMGTAGNPTRGREAAESSKDALFTALSGADHLYIAAGFGGGTGTGAAPVVGFVARELRLPTIAVISLPFAFEGQQRQRIAQAGLAPLRAMVDEVIVIQADSLLPFLGKSPDVNQAFGLLAQTIAWNILTRMIDSRT